MTQIVLCLLLSEGDAATRLFVISNLNADVGIGVLIVVITPFMGLVELDKDLFIVPRMCRYIELFTLIAREYFVIGVSFVVVHHQLDNRFWFLFHSSNIKIYFSSKHVLGSPIVGAVITVTIVNGASVSCRDDNPFFGLLLDVVEQVD